MRPKDVLRASSFEASKRDPSTQSRQWKEAGKWAYRIRRRESFLRKTLTTGGAPSGQLVRVARTPSRRPLTLCPHSSSPGIGPEAPSASASGFSAGRAPVAGALEHETVARRRTAAAGRIGSRMRMPVPPGTGGRFFGTVAGGILPPL
jgi:hypothetical protein